MSENTLPPKEPLELDNLKAIEEAGQMLAQMPDSPARREKQAKLQKAFNVVMQKYDLPAEVMGEGGLVRLAQYIPGVSYLPGLLRTAVGEGALALAGKQDAGMGQRIKDALAPDMPWVDKGAFARPALDSSDYTQKLGLMQGPEWDKPLVQDNNYIPNIPLSKRTAVNTGLNIFGDPAILLGGLKAATRGFKKAPTVESLTKQYADEIEKARGGGGLVENAKNAAKGTGKFLVDPSGTTGRWLEDWRFKDADMAAVDGGQRPVSQVWREGGKPGLTERGLGIGKEKIMKENAANIDKIVQKMPRGEDLIARAKKFYTEKFGPEVAAKTNFDEIPEEALQIQLGYKKPRSELIEPMYDVEVAKDIGTVGKTQATLGAQKAVKDLFRETDLANPDLVDEFNMAKEVAAPTKMVRNPETGAMELEINPKPGKMPDPDILNFRERFYGPEDLNASASGLQGQAASLRASAFNRADPTQQVLNKTEQRLNPAHQLAESDMLAEVGKNARNLQHETLANIDPALGAESLRSTKAMASLLKGGPFTSEAYTGPNQLSTRMNLFKKGSSTSPFTSAILDAVTGSAEVLGLGAGKALSSPWSVYGAQPVIRGSLREKEALNGQYMKDPETGEIVKNPWYMLNRDYSDRSR